VAGNVTVYISIGNSDDRLTQAQWSDFVAEARDEVRQHAAEVHGDWLSASDSRYQNACWCAVIPADGVAEASLRRRMAALRKRFGQDSAAWAVAPGTEFI
jgi:hypothetical protein